MAPIISLPGNNFRLETAILANGLLNIPSIDFAAFGNNPNQVTGFALFVDGVFKIMKVLAGDPAVLLLIMILAPCRIEYKE